MKLNIRWSKVAIVAVAIAGIVSVTFITPFVIGEIREYRAEYVATMLHPHPVNDVDQVRIVRALVESDHYYSFLFPAADDPYRKLVQVPPVPTSVVLVDYSIAFCNQTTNVTREIATCIPQVESEEVFGSAIDEPRIPKKLLKDLVAANQVSTLVPDPRTPGIVYRSLPSMNSIAASSNPSMRFESLYPGASGVVEVTRAVRSEDDKYALIYVQLRLIPKAAPGALYFLVRTGDTWRVESRIGFWIR